MNAQDMLDYTLGQMDDARRNRFEQAMASDSNLTEKVGQLDQSIALLLDDGRVIEPPTGLADRAIALVVRRRQKPAFMDFAPARVPFRWADIAVAAMVFLVATATISIPLLRSRAQMDQVNCAFNLGKLGQNLSKYSATHGSYPFVPVSYPAGTYSIVLNDAHDLPDPSVLSCPAAPKPPQIRLPDRKSFDEMVADGSRQILSMLDGHYAYHIGYRHPSGRAVPVPETPATMVPIASDQPSHDSHVILTGNSPNHGGGGQNVLFSDGSVKWRRGRWVSNRDKDLFQNEADRSAHGLHETDSVLMPAAFRVPGH